MAGYRPRAVFEDNASAERVRALPAGDEIGSAGRERVVSKSPEGGLSSV